jgi:tagaturonate epimerase
MFSVNYYRFFVTGVHFSPARQVVQFCSAVYNYIGEKASDEDIAAFVEKYKKYVGTLKIERIEKNINVTERMLKDVASKVLLAVKEAGKLYRHIESKKGRDNFITEVSMDETELAQTPVEMLFILAAIADEKIPAQTIAPKFTGRFNKGVDYVGDVKQFEKEFNEDLAVIAYAVKEFNLPQNLKLSVHSGSDKFSIYAPINKAVKKYNAGLHLKTAGTTWLEEIIGLAVAGAEGLDLAKKIYASAYGRFDELCGPYATVIDIDKSKLPSIDEVYSWTGEKYKKVVAHNQTCPDYNPNVRQLLHVGYKVAAELGKDYIYALENFENTITRHVTENILERHIKPVFGNK